MDKKVYHSPTNDNRDNIISWLAQGVPKYIIAKRVNVHTIVLRAYIRRSGIMKEVLSKMARTIGVKEGKTYIFAAEALQRAEEKGIKITLATLHAWIEKHNLGFQPGGANSKWFIDADRFDEFLKGPEGTDGQKSA